MEEQAAFAAAPGPKGFVRLTDQHGHPLWLRIADISAIGAEDGEGTVTTRLHTVGGRTLDWYAQGQPDTIAAAIAEAQA